MNTHRDHNRGGSQYEHLSCTRATALASAASGGRAERRSQSWGTFQRRAGDSRCPRSPIPRPQPPAPLLVGRDAELTHLYRLLDNALNGERQVVFVTGEAGIGKTTLVDTFLAQLADRADMRMTSGQCVEHYGPGEAYMPLLEATTRLCRGPGREYRIEGLKRYAPSWLVQLPGLLEPEDRALLQQRVQGTSRERMLREMAEAAELFAHTRALVLVLEDVHWSDLSTLEWVSYMARRRAPAKLLILGTYRPADALAGNHPSYGAVQELRARGHCEEILLTPLAEEAIGTYLAVRFQASVGTQHTAPLQQLTPMLYRRTGGNPLFIVSTVDDLIRQGVLTEDAGQWRLRAETAEALGERIPENVRQLLDRQLARLSEPEQRLLEVASVAGVEFAAAELMAGLITESEEIEAQCERLARTTPWIRESGVAEWPDGTLSGRYRFRHALYHEVVYARVAAARRVHLHRRVAERKEAAYGERVGEIATELAVHFEQGRKISRAIAYLERAGRTALQRSANAEAFRLFTHALELLVRLPAAVERTRQELTLHLALGTPLLALKGYGAPDVRRHYQQARALCRALNDPPELFPVLWGLWITHAIAGDLSEAEKFGEQLSQFAERMGDTDLALQAHHALWTTLVARGDLTTCQSHIDHGLQLYDTERHYAQTFMFGGHDPGACCRIHGAYLSWLLGYPDRALRLCEEALALGDTLLHGQTRAWALSGKAMVHHFRGEPLAAQHAAEAAIALSTEQQLALWAAYSPPVLGWALVAQGEKERGLAQTQAGLAALRATGTGIWQSQFLGLLAYTYGVTGHIQAGLETIDDALTVATRNGEHFYEAELYRLRGELTLAGARKDGSGETRVTAEEDSHSAGVKSQHAKNPNPSSQIPDPELEAEGYFLKALTIAREQSAKSWELRAATSLARLWQQQNKIRDARELLEAVYGWFSEGFDTQDVRDAEALLVTLGGRVKTATEIQQAKSTRPDATIRTEEHDRYTPLHHATRNLQVVASNDTATLTADHGRRTPDAVFRPEGDYWTVVFHGTTARIKDTRGMRYLAYLLQHPDHEFSALALAADTPEVTSSALFERSLLDEPRDSAAASVHITGFTDAGDALDPQAKAEYRQRLHELQADLEEAQTFNDIGRVEKLQAELEFVTQELVGAVGLGGRMRKAASPQERARVNVTRAIRTAMTRIAEVHPALGQHLTQAIKTGTFCAYVPAPHPTLTWQF